MFGMVVACAQGVLPAALVSSFKAESGYWHLGTLATANLDSTPDLEIVVPYRSLNGTWFVDAFKYTGQRLQGFPYSSGGEPLNVSPTIADLDADGRDEIITTRANSILALRANGSVLWSTGVDAANYVPDGGFHTITNGFYWSATGQFSPRLPSNAVFSSEVSSPVAVDLAGNGNYEVLTAWKIDPDPLTGDQDYNPFISRIYGSGEWGLMGETWSGSVISFNARTGARTFVYHMHHLVESGLAIGRATPSGPLHVYELNDSDSVVAFDKSKPFGHFGKGMLHRQFGKNQRLISGAYQYPVDIHAADIDGDGLDEVLVPGIQPTTLWQPNDTILDDDGSVLWRRWLQYTNPVNNAGWLNSASMIPCNPDRDNRVDVLSWNHAHEISFRSWTGAELADRPGWPKNFFPMIPTPPVVGDVDGDGAEEIVIGTYNPVAPLANGSLNVYSLDGVLEASLPVAGGVKHIPALADVRGGTGRCDVVFRTTTGQVYVYNFGSTSNSAISWSTHRGNMRRDGKPGASLYPSGTPLVTIKKGGRNKATFAWASASSPISYAIHRAQAPGASFVKIADLPGTTRTYTDYGLQPGVEYFYEVAAQYATGTVRSAPFAVLSLLEDNLLANSGFEECQNGHWDKWFTGTLGMTNMSGTTEEAYQGNRSMKLIFKDQASSGSIAQFNQYGIPDSTIYVSPGSYYSFGGFVKSGGLSHSSEHWLEWGSAKTGYDTNTRPSLPWPNFFTAPAVFGTGASGWLYLNRTFQLPTGIPNLELYHKFKMSSSGSGAVYLDNVFFRKIPNPADSSWKSLLPFGAKWRYSWAPPPAQWFTREFNDSAWRLGSAKFGAGGGPTNVVTSLPQLKTDYYFRTTFVAPTTAFDQLLLSATCTDESPTRLCPVQLFINGVEVPSTIDIATYQGNVPRHFDLTPFAHLLCAGTNVLAARIQNSWSDWDDVAFDLSLKAIEGSPAASDRLFISCSNPAAPQISFSTVAGKAWEVQSSDNFGPWQLVQRGTNAAGGNETVIDTGQNGRVAPGKLKCRLYRLVLP